MVYKVNGVESTEEIGKNLAKRLDSDGVKRAFIALRGEMGVGKTAFTRGFASHFGIRGVKSPTYTIVNEYSGDGVHIYHFDLYRISSSDDLFSIGYDDYVAANGYSIAEWSENIDDDIPADAIYVTISRCSDDENARIIEISDKKEGESE